MIFLEREGMEMLLNEPYQDAFFTVHATVLYGSPSRCLTRLQCIQNSLERIVLQQPSLSSRDTLQQLHWLPVKWQIQFKLAFLTYKVLCTGTPSYLCERLHPFTFLLAPCDHYPPLICTSLALIFILVHARFVLQPQQSAILSLLYSSFVSNFKHFSKTS